MLSINSLSRPPNRCLRLVTILPLHSAPAFPSIRSLWPSWIFQSFPSEFTLNFHTGNLCRTARDKWQDFFDPKLVGNPVKLCRKRTSRSVCAVVVRFSGFRSREVAKIAVCPQLFHPSLSPPYIRNARAKRKKWCQRAPRQFNQTASRSESCLAASTRIKSLSDFPIANRFRWKSRNNRFVLRPLPCSCGAPIRVSVVVPSLLLSVVAARECVRESEWLSEGGKAPWIGEEEIEGAGKWFKLLCGPINTKSAPALSVEYKSCWPSDFNWTNERKNRNQNQTQSAVTTVHGQITKDYSTAESGRAEWRTVLSDWMNRICSAGAFQMVNNNNLRPFLWTNHQWSSYYRFYYLGVDKKGESYGVREE